MRISDWSSDVCSSDLPVRHAVSLQPARGIHRVAPHVVDELVPADDPGDHGTGVDPDADGERTVVRTVYAAEFIQHPESEFGDHVRVVRSRLGEPGHRHVGVADRLDLLRAELMNQLNKSSEDAEIRRAACRERGWKYRE